MIIEVNNNVVKEISLNIEHEFQNAQSVTVEIVKSYLIANKTVAKTKNSSSSKSYKQKFRHNWVNEFK